MEGKRKRTPVLIVGAGPTGLVLALWLKKKGIDFRIIDKNNGPGKTSRALAVQARTLEFYRQLGLDQQLISLGVLADQLTLRRGGKAIAVAHLGALGKDLSPYPHLLFCSQDLHENLLCETLEKMNVKIESQTELLGFTQNEREVTIDLLTPAGKESLTADYLCGCDGAHSSVRHGLGLDFPGGTYSQVFFVADVLVEGEPPSAGVQISLSQKDFCIIMPIKQQSSVRLTGLVPSENEKKQNIVYDDVKDSVEKNTGLKVKKVNWFSVYHVHHRIAEKFHVGRVFLAGDSGHIHSPAGGQGMNTGIGDAINLAWKLADVLRGRCENRLLESYQPERMAFAKTLVKTTDTAFRFVASRSGIGFFFRAYFLPGIFVFLTRFKFFLKFVFRTVSQIRIKYPESPLSQGASPIIQAGDRLPWVLFDSVDNYQGLQNLDWLVHIYGNASKELQEFLASIKMSFKEMVWNETFEQKGFLENALYLIRPDGHIALILEKQNIQELKSYLQKIRFKL